MCNHMRYLYLLFLQMLKRVSCLFKEDLQKKALYLETVINNKKSTSSLLLYLLFITDKVVLDVNSFPDYLK